MSTSHKRITAVLLVLVVILAIVNQPAHAQDETPVPMWIRAKVEACAWEYIGFYARTSIVFQNVDPGLALALTMAESDCDRWAQSSAGATGLMQVISRPWTSSEKALFDPETNIRDGMWILSLALDLADQDPVEGIALYNCASWAVYSDNCGEHGGRNFGQHVIKEWLPIAQDVLEEMAGNDRLETLTWFPILNFWGYGVDPLPTPTATPTYTIEPTFTVTPEPTIKTTVTPTPTVLVGVLHSVEIENEEDNQMDLTIGTEQAIAFLITVLVGLLGPKPLKAILGLLKLDGQWAVLGSYVVAGIIGALALVVSSQVFELSFTLENVVAIAGLFAAAASFAFHRLKDQGRI